MKGRMELKEADVVEAIKYWLLNVHDIDAKDVWVQGHMTHPNPGVTGDTDYVTGTAEFEPKKTP